MEFNKCRTCGRNVEEQGMSLLDSTHHLKQLICKYLETEMDARYPLIICTLCENELKAWDVFNARLKECQRILKTRRNNVDLPEKTLDRDLQGEIPQCKSCNKFFKDKSLLRIHTENCDPKVNGSSITFDGITLECCLCKLTFINHQKLCQHLDQLHKDDGYSKDNHKINKDSYFCRYCGRKFTSMILLDGHKKLKFFMQVL